MKKSDVKVGNTYAYATYQGGRHECVTVLEVGAKGKDWRGHTVTGHRVQRSDGTEIFVEGRYLWSTWADHAERQAALGKARQAARSAQAVGRTQRAGRALAANRLLNALGVEDEPVCLPQGLGATSEDVAAHAASLGFHTFFDDRYGTPAVHFLVANESVLLILTENGNLNIPHDKVDTLVEAAEVFL